MWKPVKYSSSKQVPIRIGATIDITYSLFAPAQFSTGHEYDTTNEDQWINMFSEARQDHQHPDSEKTTENFLTDELRSQFWPILLHEPQFPRGTTFITVWITKQLNVQRFHDHVNLKNQTANVAYINIYLSVFM